MSGIVKIDGRLTKKSDTQGVSVFVCDPGWFDKRDLLKIKNAPPRTENLEFSGFDLNFVARVLYAESSGSHQLKDKSERLRKKAAILNVKHFRLNRQGYPNRSTPKTFMEVCKAPNQFESVYAASPKFANSDIESFEAIKKNECLDLSESIEAVREFIKNGPDAEMLFDNFRGGKGARGTSIGLSRCWSRTP